jgi:zinc protease
MNRDVPLFEITAMVKSAEDLDYVRDQVYGTIAAFQSAPPPAQRLNDLKKRQKYGFLMNLDAPNKVAGGLARFVALTGNIEVVNALYAAMDTVTPADVQEAAKTYYVPERRTVVVLKGAAQ